jgi:hypothetical protein
MGSDRDIQLYRVFDADKRLKQKAYPLPLWEWVEDGFKMQEMH